MADENKATGQVVTDPAEHDEVKPDAEQDLVEGHTHGVDETGAAAPDQADQAVINQERLANPDKRDPRWPAGSAVTAIPPSNDEHVQALNENFADQKEEALKSDSRNNPKMGADSPNQQ